MIRRIWNRLRRPGGATAYEKPDGRGGGRAPAVTAWLESGLMDLDYYSAVRGRSFADEVAAARDLVRHGMPERLSPHPPHRLREPPAGDPDALAETPRPRRDRLPARRGAGRGVRTARRRGRPAGRAGAHDRGSPPAGRGAARRCRAADGDRRGSGAGGATRLGPARRGRSRTGPRTDVRGRPHLRGRGDDGAGRAGGTAPRRGGGRRRRGGRRRQRLRPAVRAGPGGGVPRDAGRRAGAAARQPQLRRRLQHRLRTLHR